MSVCLLVTDMSRTKQLNRSKGRMDSGGPKKPRTIWGARIPHGEVATYEEGHLLSDMKYGEYPV